MSASNLPDNAKWQAMAALLTLKANHLTTDLPKRFRTLFFSRLIAENMLAILLQYIGLMLGTFSLTPAWLASGTALGLVFMRGYSVLPGLWCGSFIAYSLAGKPATLSASILLIQTIVIVFVCLRWIRPTLIFYSHRALNSFLLLTGLVTATSTALLPSITPWMANTLANFNGVLLFSFPLVTLDAFFPQWESLVRSAKTPLLFYALLLCGSLLFVMLSNATLLSDFMLGAVLIRISIRYGWCGSIGGTFITGFLLVLGSIFSPTLYSTHLITLETIIGLASFLSLHIGVASLAKTLR